MRPSDEYDPHDTRNAARNRAILDELRTDAEWNDQQDRYRLAALIVGVVMFVALVAWSIGRGS